MPKPSGADPTQRIGTYRSRVFVGGSYYGEERSQLDVIKLAVSEAGFNPVIADLVNLENPDDIHHETMVQLHQCRLAIFELSQPSGALMEIERVPDYGIQAPVLFNAPKTSEYTGSRMLSTFVKQHRQTIRLSSYLQAAAARQIVRDWLDLQRQGGFG